MRIEERLARVEDALRDPTTSTSDTAGRPTTTSEVGSTPRDRRASVSTNTENLSLASRLGLRDDSRTYFQHIVSVPHYDFSFRQTAGEAVTARPSMISFHSTWYIQFENWDDTKDFYDDELAAEDYLFHIMNADVGQGLDMTARTVWQLQQNFVMNFLQSLPLLEVKTFTDHVEASRAAQFSRKSSSDCLVMFALAIGSLDRNKHSPLTLGLDKGPHPGLNYFNAARQIMTTLQRGSRRRDVTMLQCRIMEACYWHMVLRPLLAWDAIMEIARDCMHILSSSSTSNMPPLEKQNFHRVFWITSVVLHELEAILKLHPIGLRQFHEVVPLPLSDAEDEGYLSFYAQCSLRKLLTETLDIVGYRVGQVIYAPVVAAELNKQVEEWYNHLPPSVRFPVTNTPLFDLRKAFLRFQYLSLHAVIFWPSVLQMLEHAASRTLPSKNSSRVHELQSEAQHFVRYSHLVCEACEELLMECHLGLQFTIWSSYANCCMLMIIYQSPALAFIPQASDDGPIRKVFRLLHHWKDVKSVWRVLKRTRGQLVRLGIRVDDIP